MTTTIRVERQGTEHQLWHSPGLLRAQRLHGAPDLCRVGLVATTALLLGGDRVEIEIDVGPGARLELIEVAGTVAYAGRGRSAWWTTHVTLHGDAQLTYRGEPFVVADGADVMRSLSVRLASSATAVLRETLVLGRSGERGGRLRSDTLVTRAGLPVLVEQLELEPVTRSHPGLLGDATIIDTLLALGCDAEQDAPTATRFRLADGRSTVLRFLGGSLAESPIRPPTARSDRAAAAP